ncbi:MAG: hypothetical protein ACK5XS_07140 [Armatimonadota bacterium]|jgi:hypothetical protein|nr:hypothetical protein [Fimbriimonadaceae bacterium]MCZ8137704.1 hypothetical protein [Fimbriimonadaceae bacterium]
MKEKIFMIAVAASAGYAGGQLSSSQPKEVLASKITLIDSPRGPSTVITPNSFTMMAAESSSTLAGDAPFVSISVRELSGTGKDMASMMINGGDNSAPIFMAGANSDTSFASVGLLDKSEILLEYKSRSGASLWHVIGGSRRRNLASD